MLNNYEFAKILDLFHEKELRVQEKRNSEAKAILDDSNRKWDSPQQRESAEAKYVFMQERRDLLMTVHQKGMELVKHHESVTDKLASWYVQWYNNISNEGLQETEIMAAQANLLNQIFDEMYNEIKGLGLPIKPPQALNMK